MYLEFWFDFGSTYSYPAAMRIEALAEERSIPVRWRPFVLGATGLERLAIQHLPRQRALHVA